MTLFEKIIAGGGYTMPFLVHLHSKDGEANFYFVNDNKAVTYDGKTYSPAAFSYTPEASSNGFDGGGKLSIAARENKIVAAVDTYKEIYLDVAGILDENGDVEVLERHTHLYGSVTISNDKADFVFEKDARLSMQFPALMWNRQNNRGNS